MESDDGVDDKGLPTDRSTVIVIGGGTPEENTIQMSDASWETNNFDVCSE